MEVLSLQGLPDYLRAAVEAGVDSRVICPKCQGGSSHERSLSVRQIEDAVVKLACFRSTCDWYAYVPSNGTKYVPGKLAQGSVFEGATLRLTDETTDYLWDTYQIPQKYASRRWMQTPNGVLVMPVRSPTGTLRGHTTRTLGLQPKRCMTYKETAQPWLDWFLAAQNDQTRLVIVEDQLSAARLAMLGIDAVALLGTNMNDADATEIGAYCIAFYDRTYIALDRDAFEKSLKLAARFRHIMPVLPVCLDEDIKNMPTNEAILKMFP